MILAELRRLFKLLGKLFIEPPLLQPADGRQLLLRRVHGLAQVGCLAVHPAVDAVAKILLHLGLHDSHGAHRRAQCGEKILDLIALLEIEHMAPRPGDTLGRKAHLLHEVLDLPAHPQVGRGQLQMVALLRVGHRTAGHERSPQKRHPAAVLL